MAFLIPCNNDIALGSKSGFVLKHVFKVRHVRIECIRHLNVIHWGCLDVAFKNLQPFYSLFVSYILTCCVYTIGKSQWGSEYLYLPSDA